MYVYFDMTPFYLLRRKVLFNDPKINRSNPPPNDLTKKDNLMQTDIKNPERADGSDCPPSSCSEIIIGGKYRSRNMLLANCGVWELVSADLHEGGGAQTDTVRLVPENKMFPISWESTKEEFAETFEYLPNVQRQSDKTETSECGIDNTKQTGLKMSSTQETDKPTKDGKNAIEIARLSDLLDNTEHETSDSATILSLILLGLALYFGAKLINIVGGGRCDPAKYQQAQTFPTKTSGSVLFHQ